MNGILFKPDMIKEIVEGRKTQTRRVIKDPRRHFNQYNKGLSIGDIQREIELNLKPNFPSRYQVGEVVYIKEAFRVYGWDDEGGQFWLQYKDEVVGQSLCVTDEIVCKYWAPNNYWPEEEWHNPRTMPAWAARYFILITDVRAERLQEITWQDCVKEGITAPDHAFELLIGNYQTLWDSINPKHPWASNPWVWRYEFKKVEK